MSNPGELQRENQALPGIHLAGATPAGRLGGSAGADRSHIARVRHRSGEFSVPQGPTDLAVNGRTGVLGRDSRPRDNPVPPYFAGV